MFRLIRKKDLIKRMKVVKDSNRFEKLYGKHPSKTDEQHKLNCYSQGYEDGTDNFYHALESYVNNN